MIPAKVAAIATFMISFLGLAPALAQRTPGVTLSILVGGTELHFHKFGWTGIVGDDIDTSNAIREIIATVQQPGTEVLPRWLVSFVCNGRCEKLPEWNRQLRYPDDKGHYAETRDAVVWKDGSRTRGRVEVHCPNQNDVCQVYQDGQPVHPDQRGDWRDVSYVELVWVKH